MWIMRFTFRRFLRFAVVDLFFNIGFAYGFLGWFLVSQGIFAYTGGSPLLVLIVTTVHGMGLYLYQLWQEKIFTESPSEGQ